MSEVPSRILISLSWKREMIFSHFFSYISRRKFQRTPVCAFFMALHLVKIRGWLRAVMNREQVPRTRSRILAFENPFHMLGTHLEGIKWLSHAYQECAGRSSLSLNFTCFGWKIWDLFCRTVEKYLIILYCFFNIFAWNFTILFNCWLLHVVLTLNINHMRNYNIMWSNFIKWKEMRVKH